MTYSAIYSKVIQSTAGLLTPRLGPFSLDIIVLGKDVQKNKSKRNLIFY